LPAYAAALERGRKRANDVASNAALIQELHPSLAQTQ